MEKGPDGFIIGQFGKHVVVLDAPNLMLVSVPTSKKRPAANTMKKPAAADGSAEEKADDVDVAKETTKKCEAFFEDPTNATILSPDIKQPVFKIYLKNGGKKEYETVKTYYYTAHVVQIICIAHGRSYII